MLEVLVNFICQLLMIVIGFYIIAKINSQYMNIKNVKNIIVILLSLLLLSSLYQIRYSGIYTILIFLVNIIIYKIIFKESIPRVIILASIVMLITFIADMLCGLLLMLLFTTNEIRQEYILRIVATVLICIVSCLITKFFTFTKISTKLNKLFLNAHYYSSTIFLILTIVVFTIISSNVFIEKQLSLNIIGNFILIAIFLSLLYLFLKEKDNYSSLSNEYDNLFNYVQQFEEWIEKEQLNRHEYKNQLAVLRCLTKEKKVKNKIDEILEDNINIEGQEVTNLKNLPKGGIKGLMYYKAAIAQKQKIHLTTDVSIESNGILTRLKEKDIRILCKLIGIYFDNAIEAAAESRKKILTIEVYELKDRVNFVFSNTFKNHNIIKDRNMKGVSSKGEGRGNGLYFASKLIRENSWLEERQEIIDNYYIEQLTIKDNNPK